MRRKFLASILAFCMVLTLFPLTAFAVDLNPMPGQEDVKSISEINGTWASSVYTVTVGNGDAKTILDGEGDLTAYTIEGNTAGAPTQVTYTKSTGELALTFGTAPTESTEYLIVSDKSGTKSYVKVTAYVAPTATVTKGTVGNLTAGTVEIPVTVTVTEKNNDLSGEVSVTARATQKDSTRREGNVLTGKANYTANGATNVTLSGTLAAGTWTLTITELKVGNTIIDDVTDTDLEVTVGAAVDENKGNLSATDFTFVAPGDLIYDGNAKEASVTTDNEDIGEITIEYYLNGNKVENAINVGTYTVKINVAANEEYNAATGLTGETPWTFTIAPKPITEAEVTAIGDQTYTGSEITPATTVTLDSKTLTAGTDYTVEWTNNTNVGDATGTITGKGNYTGTATNKATFTITKRNTDLSVSTYVKEKGSDDAVPTTIVLANVAGLPSDTYEYAIDSGTSYTGLTADITTTPGSLVLTPTDGTASETTTVKVIATGANNVVNITFNVTFTNKSIAVISATVENATYDGTPKNGYSGEPTLDVTLADAEFTYTYSSEGGTAPTNAGTYTVTINLKENASYVADPLVLSFTIAKATPTVSAPTMEPASVSESGKTLADVTLTGGTATDVNGDALAGTFAWVNDPSTEITQGTAYNWKFTPDDVTNYDVFTSSTGLTPWASSGGGTTPGGNGGTTTPTDPTDPTEPTDPNPPSSGEDVSETVTPEINEGTASATVDQATADKIVSDAVDNNSENVTVKVDVPADADVNEVKADIPASAVADLASKTDANLTVETPVANVTLPNETLAQLGGASGNVTVTAAVNEDNSVKVEVQSNGSTVGSLNGGMKVDLPVSQPTAGTVAVLVDENGNETILPKSAVDGSEMAVLLETGSATIKFVDNAQSFADTDSHWAKNSIAFVSSRNLFQGMENNNFKADVPMNRAMLVTVLHRLESTPAAAGSSFDDVPSDSYYATAAAWAAGKGIVTGDASGFSGDRNVTREEMAVMLYRYVQTINGNKGTLGSFSNMGGASDVSGWATEAMRWAVGSGIISGDNSGNLNPGSTATRGEVSQMLMNFVKLITK